MNDDFARKFEATVNELGDTPPPSVLYQSITHRPATYTRIDPINVGRVVDRLRSFSIPTLVNDQIQDRVIRQKNLHQDRINQLAEVVQPWGYDVAANNDIVTITQGGAYLRLRVNAVWYEYVDHSAHPAFDAFAQSASKNNINLLDGIMKHLRPAPSEGKPLEQRWHVPQTLRQALIDALCPHGFTIGSFGGNYRIFATQSEWVRPFATLEFTYRDGVVSSLKADGVSLKHPACATLKGIEGAIAVDALVQKLAGALALTDVQTFDLYLAEVRSTAERHGYTVTVDRRDSESGIQRVTIARADETWRFKCLVDRGIVRFMGGNPSHRDLYKNLTKQPDRGLRDWVECLHLGLLPAKVYDNPIKSFDVFAKRVEDLAIERGYTFKDEDDGLRVFEHDQLIVSVGDFERRIHGVIYPLNPDIKSYNLGLISYDEAFDLIQRELPDQTNTTPPAPPTDSPTVAPANEVERFWIVCNDVRNLNATYRHGTERSAIKEAGRLQAKIGGQFLIFQCVGAVNKSGVAAIVDPLPF